MITIIIATYNAELFLQKTLTSLKSQTCRDFELIVVDGLSTDGTVDIIRSNNDIVNNFIVEKDNGLYDAWNKGVKISNGEWICFLGAGDTFVPEAICQFNRFIENNTVKGVDYISAKINRSDSSGNVFTTIGEAWRWSKFKNIMTVAHVGSLHSKSLFNEIGYFNTDYKICADYEFLLRKQYKLQTAFLDYVIGSMPIGGTSFTVAALKESAKAKYYTAKQPLFKVVIIYLFQLAMLKSFVLRHKTNRIIKA